MVYFDVTFRVTNISEFRTTLIPNVFGSLRFYCTGKSLCNVEGEKSERRAERAWKMAVKLKLAPATLKAHIWNISLAFSCGILVMCIVSANISYHFCLNNQCKRKHANNRKHLSVIRSFTFATLIIEKMLFFKNGKTYAHKYH